MSNKICQLYDADGNGMLPMSTTDAIAAGNQSLTKVLEQMLNKISNLETTINNLSSFSGEKLESLSNDISTLVADVSTLKKANTYQVIE